MTALVDRQERAADRMTIAVADAIAMSLDPDYAAKWQAQRGTLGTGSNIRPPMDEVTLRAVMRQFPGAIKVN